jgi:hypothetical protein
MYHNVDYLKGVKLVILYVLGIITLLKAENDWVK